MVFACRCFALIAPFSRCNVDQVWTTRRPQRSRNIATVYSHSCLRLRSTRSRTSARLKHTCSLRWFSPLRPPPCREPRTDHASSLSQPRVAARASQASGRPLFRQLPRERLLQGGLPALGVLPNLGASQHIFKSLLAAVVHHVQENCVEEPNSYAGVTVQEIAVAMTGKASPDANEIARARRRLDGLVNKGLLHRQDGLKGGRGGGTPSLYFAVVAS